MTRAATQPEDGRCAHGHDLTATDAWQRDDGGVYRCRLCTSEGRDPGAWLKSASSFHAATPMLRRAAPTPATGERPCLHEGRYTRADGQCERCVRAAYNRERRAKAKVQR